MKLILACLCLLLSGFGSPPADISNDVAASIRSGNARELSAYFGTSIDLTVDGKEEMYSKAQAEQVIRGFFMKHPPQSFVLTHQSSNPASSQYGIGTYHSRSKKKFRIYFLIRKIGNQSFLQQLSIEPEK